MAKKAIGSFVDENIYDIKFYPPRLRPIVRLLMKYEDKLSDGFEWYGSVELITKLAEDLYKLKKKDEKQD